MISPNWKTISADSAISDKWSPWLSNVGSMTQALEKASGERMQVIVQQEGWQLPWPDELEVLKVHAQLHWIREVVLITGEPVMFARSVFPKKIIEHFPALTLLGGQPLGHTLFGGEDFTRSDIEVAKIVAKNNLWQQMPARLKTIEEYWARRSLFYSAISPLLLTEVFLPYVATL